MRFLGTWARRKQEVYEFHVLFEISKHCDEGPIEYWRTHLFFVGQLSREQTRNHIGDNGTR